MKSIIKVIFTIMFGMMIALLAYLLINKQFNIYQKKHGSQMTWVDFFLDPEVK